MTPREARFVPQYLIDLNGAAAAVRAGYSERSAKKIASELLQRPVVRAAVEAGLAKQQAKVLMSADEVALGIQRVGLKAEARGENMAALRAFELLGKRHKMFTEKVEHTGPDGGPVQFQRIERTVVDPK
jgi:phage terminase small subunit